MKVCTLVLGIAQNLNHAEGDLIGVDRGAFICASQKQNMVLALGDFDSVTSSELEFLSGFAQEVIRLAVMKDETDTLAALIEVSKRGYDKIILLGGLEGRQDHQYANLMLLTHRKENIEIRNDNNIMFRLHEGVWTLKKNHYRFISFFALSPTSITLQGFLYPLDHYCLTSDNIIGISNEIIGDTATITIEKGSVLVMRCNDSK